MRKLTKKYIFEQKLNGKPIVILVEEGHGRWATKEDLVILREYGIIIECHGDEWPKEQSIATHEILTYLIPFDIRHGPVTRILKGQVMPGFSDINVTD